MKKIMFKNIIKITYILIFFNNQILTSLSNQNISEYKILKNILFPKQILREYIKELLKFYISDKTFNKEYLNIIVDNILKSNGFKNKKKSMVYSIINELREYDLNNIIGNLENNIFYRYMIITMIYSDIKNFKSLFNDKEIIDIINKI